MQRGLFDLQGVPGEGLRHILDLVSSKYRIVKAHNQLPHGLLLTKT